MQDLMIQGHDGSLWRCFGDFRDNLLLDLEKEFTTILSNSIMKIF